MYSISMAENSFREGAEPSSHKLVPPPGSSTTTTPGGITNPLRQFLVG